MKRIYVLVGFVVTFLLVGCVANQREPIGISENSQPQVGTDNSPQAISTSTLTATLMPTFTEIPTRAATATGVPIATLGIDDTEEAIRFLFETNNYCDFPCWWGIVPGVTKWADTEEFLSPLAARIYHRSDLNYLEDGYKQHIMNFEVSTMYDPDGIFSFSIIEDGRGVVNRVYVITNFEEMGFDLLNFLETFSHPSEIFIYVRGSLTIWVGDEGDYTIVLYYEDDGILIAYDGKTDIVNMSDEFVEICTSRMIHEYAWLQTWDTAQNYSFDKLSTPGLDESGALEFREINEISDFDVSGFFEGVTDPNVTNFCFKVENSDYQG